LNSFSETGWSWLATIKLLVALFEESAPERSAVLVPAAHVYILVGVFTHLNPFVCDHASPLSSRVETAEKVLLLVYSPPLLVEILGSLFGHKGQGRHQRLPEVTGLQLIFLQFHRQIFDFR
jgi:hypothetical protein